MKKAAGLIIALVVIFLFFTWRLPGTFATPQNIETMMRQNIVIGFAAVGMTWIIVTGAIDLSVGSLVALVSVLVAALLQRGWDPVSAAACGVLAGVIGGALNGALTAWMKVGSFIVTLATLLAFRGLAKGIAQNKTINASETFLTNLTASLGQTERWKLLPTGAWLLLIAVVLASLAMRYTVFGRRVIATGSNALTARLCGVNPALITLCVFMIGGLCAGIAGLVQFSRLNAGDPTANVGLELQVIAAVVIGGASLTGGEGSVPGALLGALIMQTISTGSRQMGLDNWIQEILTASIILGAVCLDRWRISKMAARSSG